MKVLVSNFPKDIFWNLSEVYEGLDVDSSLQLKESDILSLSDVKSPEELKSKIENIKTKLIELKKQISEKRDTILKEHKKDIKELVSRKKEQKEKQVETLEFMKSCWFDLIDKSITDKIVTELQWNRLHIPWLNLNVQNIDLENWHFWESKNILNENTWININAKRNLVKFVNKILSWNSWEPLGVEAIASGTSKVKPTALRAKLEDNWLVSSLGWNYSRISENLRKKQKS